MPAAKLLDVGPEGKQRLDRYELVAEIASGGMATVFLARLSGMGGFQRFVAIKRLHPHLAGEQEFVDMFLDEARLAAQIHHPNVVPILEVGASDRGYYIVMEYIEGDTLARLLARAATVGNRVPAPIGVRVLVDTLAGLHAAHELHDQEGKLVELVHRDVSPQNVLVGVDGLTRITDFGVARAESRLSATRVGQLKGKIAYMAPEQAAGSPDVDRRADVFSAGIVLWEVLAGRRLFKAENEAATLSRVVSEPIPRLTQIAPDISLRLSAVAMKALDRDVEKRFQTCRDFADALEEAATASKTIASQRDVATYVGEVLGQEISQARDAVRAWLARSEPSQVAVPEVAAAHGYASSPPSSTVSAAGVTVASPLAGAHAGQSVPPARSRRGVWIGAGAVAALGLVVALLASRGGEEGRAVGAALPPPPQPSPARPAGAEPPQPTPTAAASAEVTPAKPEPAATAEPAGGAEPASKAAGGAARAGRGAALQRPPSEKPTAPAKPPPKDDSVDLSNPYR